MILLDIKTVFFGYAVSNAICMAVVFVLWLQNRRRFSGLGLWLADFVMQFVALSLIILRGHMPDLASMTLSNSLLIGGTILLYMGLQRFVGKHSTQIYNILLLTVFIPSHAYFVLVHPDLEVRTVLLMVGLSIICFQCAWLLLRGVDAEMRPITYSLGVVFAIYCLISLARILVNLAFPATDNFFNSNLFDTLLILMDQMLFIILTFNLFLMVNRRLVVNLESDIIERESAHKALRSSEERFRQLMMSAPDAVIGVDQAGEIVFANVEATKLFGYQIEELLGKDVDLLIPDQVRDNHSIHRAGYVANPVPRPMGTGLEITALQKDGGKVPVDINLSHLNTDDGMLVIVFVRDITKRMQTEKKVQQLSRATEQSPASIVITDISGKIEYVNRRFTEVTGYSTEEAVGQNPRILSTGKTPRETYNQLWSTITVGKEWRGEFVNRKKNGNLYYEAATISPISDPNGDITHYLAVKEDITERKEADAKLQYQNERLNTLHDITLDLLNRHKMEDVLDTILLRASDLLESPFGLLDIIEDDMLAIKATTEMTESLKGMRVPMKESHLSSAAIETHQPQILQDYSQWMKRLRTHDMYQLKAVANFPIMIDENVVGVIALGRVEPGKAYTDEEIQVMSSFAHLAALAMDNAQLFSAAQNELAEKVHAEEELRRANQTLLLQLEAIEQLQVELREQAIRDPLTGLYNRRYLNEVMEHEFARAERESYPISLVMIDIDHFKQTNDDFGHTAGDMVLKRLAAILLGHTRVGDIVCRYGGEEFLVILPNVTAELTFQIAERWRILFQETRAPFENEGPTTTMSCGISSYPKDGNTIARVISAADKALYQAKMEGRNRVTINQAP